MRNLAFSKFHPNLMLGMTLGQLDLQKKYGLTVLEVRREKASQRGLLKNVEQKLAGPDTVLYAGDILFLSGDREQAQLLAEEQKLVRMTGRTTPTRRTMADSWLSTT